MPPTTTAPRRTIAVPASFFDGPDAGRCAQCHQPVPQYIERDEHGADTARCLTCGCVHEAERGRFWRARDGKRGDARHV